MWRYVERLDGDRIVRRYVYDGPDVGALLVDRPWLFRIALDLVEPDEHGHCSATEIPVVFDIVIRLSEGLFYSADAVVLAHSVASGVVTVAGYAQDSRGLHAAARQAIGPVSQHFRLRGEPDPEHRHYHDDLVPTATERAVDDTLYALHLRLADGDDVERARPVVHVLRLPTAEDRADLVRAALDQGLDVQALSDAEPPLPFGLELVVESTLELAVIAMTVQWLSEAAVRRSGTYEGWEADVVEPEGAIPIPPALEALSPDDARLLEDRRQVGDTLEAPRPVRHQLWFGSLNHRLKAETLARRLGFGVETGDSPVDGLKIVGRPFELVLVRDEPLVPAIFLPVVARLRALAVANAGHYAGWEGVAVAMVDPTAPTDEERAQAEALRGRLANPPEEAPVPAAAAPRPARGPAGGTLILAGLALAAVTIAGAWFDQVTGGGADAMVARGLAVPELTARGIEPGDRVVWRHSARVRDEDAAHRVARWLRFQGYGVETSAGAHGWELEITHGGRAAAVDLAVSRATIVTAIEPWDGVYWGWEAEPTP